ncbi:MAG: large-conductance mechanosensitive channel protein MscL [Anaerolineales bacterium]
MLKEFREFVARGNVVDLAVGVVIGASFGAVVTSLVNDMIMPPVGLLLNGVNFKDLFISLNGKFYPSLAAAQAAGAPTINYGNFINTLIDFLIVALVIFLLVKGINRMKRPAPAESPTTKECPYCHTTIPFKATRCPNCTSDITAPAAKQMASG